MPSKKPENPSADATAAAVEANPDPAPEVADAAEGAIRVEFRGLQIDVPGPDKWARSYRLRMATASGDSAQLLDALLGPIGTRLVASVIDEDKDDFEAVVEEFFKAYTAAAGAGNS